MKIEIEVTDPADVSAILNLLAGKGDWPGQPVLTPSEASEGERVEKHAAQQEAPKKRGPGRPRMTEEEKAEAARKRAAEKAAKERAEAEAAAKAAKEAEEAEEDDSAEEPEPITEDDLEKDTGKAAALEDEDEDDSDDDSDKDPMEEAVELATKYLRDGNGKEVRRALKSVGASRVSDLKGAKVQEFLEIIKSI